MARLYADENFPRPVVAALRALGHDVLTAQEAGQAGQGIADEAVLEYAITRSRAVLTINRRDFVRLHRANPAHSGLITCTQDSQVERQARRIHETLLQQPVLVGQLIHITRPGPDAK